MAAIEEGCLLVDVMVLYRQCSKVREKREYKNRKIKKFPSWAEIDAVHFIYCRGAEQHRSEAAGYNIEGESTL